MKRILVVLALLLSGCAAADPAPAERASVHVVNATSEDLPMRLAFGVPDAGAFANASNTVAAGARWSPELPNVPFGSYDLRLETPGRAREARISFGPEATSFTFLVERDRIGFQATQPLR